MIRIGVGGYPPSYFDTPLGKDRMRIFEWLAGLGLTAFEAMMTYGPRTKESTCALMRRLSGEFGIKVSVHAAYYIVLTSADREKAKRSADMLERTFELADIMGSDTVVLHPGSLYGRTSRETALTLEDNLAAFFGRVGKTDVGLFLETAGKKAQFGSLDEILSVTERVEGCYPCIDFGHLHARTGGGLASDGAVDEVFRTLKTRGALSPSGRIHFHYTPIHYGPRGEIQHRRINDAYTPEDAAASGNPRQAGNMYLPRCERIIENMQRLSVAATIISETLNSQQEGALAMKACLRKATTV